MFVAWALFYMRWVAAITVGALKNVSVSCNISPLVISLLRAIISACYKQGIFQYNFDGVAPVFILKFSRHISHKHQCKNNLHWKIRQTFFGLLDITHLYLLTVHWLVEFSPDALRWVLVAHLHVSTFPEGLHVWAILKTCSTAVMAFVVADVSTRNAGVVIYLLANYHCEYSFVLRASNLSMKALIMNTAVYNYLYYKLKLIDGVHYFQMCPSISVYLSKCIIIYLL